MATGTPVVDFRAGSVPEAVVDGVTGFVADTLHDMAEAIPRVRKLDWRACRTRVERYFSPSAMDGGYEDAYAAVTATKSPVAGIRTGGTGAAPPRSSMQERGTVHA